MIRKLLVLVCMVLLGIKMYAHWGNLESNWLVWIFVHVNVVLQVMAIFALVFERYAVINMAIPFIIYFGFGGLILSPWSRGMAIDHAISISLVLVIAYAILARLKRLQILRLVVGVFIGIIVFVPFWLCRSHYLKKHPQYQKIVVL